MGKTARHGTYFEMLGNFSFGDYFKHEAIAWSWEFLTSPQWVGLEADRLYPSIYLDDDEAFDIWNKEIGIPKERIFRFGKEDNFWEHGSGPCGPCSEIYYDRGPEFGCGKPGCTVGCDCDRYIEIWNNVFSQFDNDGQGHYTELKQKNIDTGMGLERLACVCQNVESLFDVDTVMNITHKVSQLTGAHYGETEKRDVSLRVITDHIRSATFMICDGILPSNEGRGYVLRRLLRRAARHGKLLGVNEPFLYQVVDTVIHENQGQYPDLREKQTYITKVIRTEEENFGRTIDGGMKIFSDLLAEHQAKGEKVFSGADAFRLYDTFGFPIDLTAEMVAEQGMTVDEESFRQLMQEQKQRAREARKALGDLGWAGVEFGKDIPATEFVGYDHDELGRHGGGSGGRGRAAGRDPRRVRRRGGAGQVSLLCGDGRPGGRPRHHQRPGHAVHRDGRAEEQGRQIHALRAADRGRAPCGRHRTRRHRHPAPQGHPPGTQHHSSAGCGPEKGAGRPRAPGGLPGGAGPAALRLHPL